MDKEKAKMLLSEALDQYKNKSHIELAKLIGTQETSELEGYQIEIQFFWDDKAGGDIRVIGSIHDGCWSAIKPLTDDFILKKSGQVIG